MWEDESCPLQFLIKRLRCFVSQEPLRVAMANHLRSLLSTINIGGDVLEQSVQLVTNDNLDLGCAVIEKAATEKVHPALVQVLARMCRRTVLM
jgi:hypothetical protein